MSEGQRVLITERRLVYTARTCAMCGATFEGWGKARFCSKRCQRNWDYRQHAESRRQKRRDRYQRQREQPPSDRT